MSDLMITGVIDGPLTGGLPKAVQLIALNDIPDLSIYGVGSANNGGGTDGEEFTFPADTIAAGTVIYLASETDGFTSFFGFAPDYTASTANINGDDAIELFLNGEVVDLFGDQNVDGTGQPWDHLDGWAAREPAVGPSATFDPAEWTFSGPNALDGETSNATAANPFPMPAVSAPVQQITINEYRFTAEVDFRTTSNFVELLTEPGATLDGLTLLIINGENQVEGDNIGAITWAVDLTGAVADENGFVLIGNDALTTFDPGDVIAPGFDPDGNAQTMLIVSGFTGAAGDDLDINDDGTIDNPPFTDIVVGLALEDQDFREDVLYADDVVQADPLAPGFISAAAARQPDGDGDFVTLSYYTPEDDTPGSTNVTAPPPSTFDGIAVINEFRVSVTGSDAGNNFFEIKTDPGASLAGLTLLEIDAEGEAGTIKAAYDLSAGVADANGFVLLSDGTVGTEEAGDITVPGFDPNGAPATYMLVDSFTGAVGDDLDTNNDSKLDVTPFGQHLRHCCLCR